MLSRFKLRTKLGGMLVMFVLLAAGIIWHDSTSLYQRMIDDRIDKLQAATEVVRGQIEPLYAAAASGALSQPQLLAQVRDLIHHARYDNGSGYFTVMDPDGLIVAFGPDPAREDVISQTADAKGKKLTDIIADGYRTSSRKSIIVSYDFPKPGQKQPLQKLAYVARVQGTNLDLISGAWVDDIDAQFRAALIRSVMIGGVLLVLVIVIAWLINRDISGSLTALKRAMQQIAHGELTRPVPGTERRDEVGEMAAVVEVFKENAARIGQMQEQQLKTEQEAAAEKRRSVLKLAEEFESQVGAVATRVASSAGVMHETAVSMNASVDQTVANAVTVADSFRQSAGNVQSVAAAVEELSSSIQEISRQVTTSSTKAEEAVSASSRSQDLVEELSAAASQVGAVTNLISEIAGRTNLLALNATIEAARAGESGKGFAVVASEVKNLASQTAKATDEISQHITRIQTVTEQTVKAIAEIAEMIQAMSSTSAAIAAAVEEQGAVTTDIGRSVAEVAANATQMTTTLDQVTHAVSEDGAAAGTVLGASEDLQKEAQSLRARVDHLLGELRAA